MVASACRHCIRRWVSATCGVHLPVCVRSVDSPDVEGAVEPGSSIWLALEGADDAAAGTAKDFGSANSDSLKSAPIRPRKEVLRGALLGLYGVLSKVRNRCCYLYKLTTTLSANFCAPFRHRRFADRGWLLVTVRRMQYIYKADVTACVARLALKFY